jgi:hypothetical protein
MPRIRYVAGALTLAMGSVSFGLMAATASAGTATGTATAGGATATGTATGTVTSTPSSGTTGTPVPQAVVGAPAPVAPAPAATSDPPVVQVVAGNSTGPCSPISAQQVNNSNNTVAINNGSANNSPALNVSNGQSSAPGNGRGTGDIGKNNSISQNVNVSCFNSAPTRTVVVPQVVTRTVVVQQAPVASAVTTTAHFTG